jgi:hypothetical protein
MGTRSHRAYYFKHTTEEADVGETMRRLRHVLAGQRFPAERWELIVGAEHYGADGLSLRELRELPATRFRSFGDVLLAVERGRRTANGSDRSSGPPPPARGTPRPPVRLHEV